MFGVNRIVSWTAAVSLLLTAGTSWAQGAFERVTAEDLVAMTLDHHFGPDRKSQKAEFTWTFNADGTFVVKKDKGPIAPHLLRSLLALKPEQEPPAVEQVDGRWSLKDGRLVLTHLRAGDAAGAEKVELHPYRTAPTIIRIDDWQTVGEKRAQLQYVFWTKR